MWTVIAVVCAFALGYYVGHFVCGQRIWRKIFEHHGYCKHCGMDCAFTRPKVHKIGMPATTIAATSKDWRQRMTTENATGVPIEEKEYA